jgi:UDP:flavonoid glycosyltransferase YjiC (YdhE family)
MAAVVHHGGAGTTAAALRAGVPAVITPFLADQPSWARVVHGLGAGPRPVPFPELTVDRLAAAIKEAVTSPTIHRRAEDVAAALRAEDGVGRAVALILDYASHYPPNPSAAASGRMTGDAAMRSRAFETELPEKMA